MTDYATATQLAAFYQISRSMVYKIVNRMLENPETRVLKIGTLTRIPRDEFEDFLRANTEKGAKDDIQREEP